MDATSTVMQIGQNQQANLDAWGQLYDNAKVADMMVKANPDLVQRMGFQSPEQFKSLSAQDKIAATTGYIKQQGIAEHVARLNDYAAQAAQRQQQVQDDQSVGDFLQNYGKAPETMPDENGADQPLTPQQKFNWALVNTPGMSGRNIPKAIDSLTKWQAVTAKQDAADALDAAPEAMTMPDGGTVYFQRHTKNPMVVSPMTKSAARVDEINAQAESNKSKGLLPEGTTFETTANGLAIATLPDGSTKFLGKAPAAAKDRKSFFAQFMGGGATTTSAPAATPAKDSAPVQEVIRNTKDGRKAVFDATTKQFLRYAN